ncbi:MAG: hypothetical protein U0930_20070 [Pirellulales bacterium]
MNTIILAMIGVVIIVVVFVAGVLIGHFSRDRESVKKWLDDHGCYTCNETYRYSSRSEIDDLFDS